VTSDPLASLLGSVSSGAAAASTAGGGETVGVDDILAPGDRVSAGASVVTIIDVSEIGLVGEVDETDVLLVSPGITADVELDAAPGLRFEATVGTVDLLPTPSNRAASPTGSGSRSATSVRSRTDRCGRPHAPG
jgi:hypothetical protein